MVNLLFNLLNLLGISSILLLIFVIFGREYVHPHIVIGNGS